MNEAGLLLKKDLLSMHLDTTVLHAPLFYDVVIKCAIVIMFKYLIWIKKKPSQTAPAEHSRSASPRITTTKLRRLNTIKRHPKSIKHPDPKEYIFTLLNSYHW